MTKRKIILDVDTGTDDAMAIIAAALASELDLIGITVVHGNQRLPYTLENTLRLVEFLGKDIPVYGGCPDPMVQNMSNGRMQNPRMQTILKIIDGKEIEIHDKYLDLPEAMAWIWLVVLFLLVTDGVLLGPLRRWVRGHRPPRAVAEGPSCVGVGYVRERT